MVLKIGHRGACGYEPENTILSFRKAVNMGMDFIEFDVHLSKDDNVIIMHDDTLDRTTDGAGKISEKNLDEIKKYKTIQKKQEIPTLQEVIKKLKGKIKFNIELKDIKSAKKVVDLINKNKIEKDVIIASNCVKSLNLVKEKSPRLKTSLEYYATKTRKRGYIFIAFSLLIFPITKIIITKKAKSAKVDYIHINHYLITKNFVEKLHKLNYKVIAWTVNDVSLVKKMISKKVDGIITNYPDILNI